MGVPAFFRWLSRKYTAIVVYCQEEKPQEVDGVKIPVDGSKTNPNNIEFDNLYLDMNGIIHPCCHPENKPAPKNEDEMMVLIFEYIDRIFNIVRPRRLLYMAIDGVAPRAKMNQQRSRRFRASKEAIEKAEEIESIKTKLRDLGALVPEPKEKVEHFDSNCITPGTPFMDRLAKCLRYYVHDRLNNDPGWRNIKVILSDANVPGEGEHKIMDYIRRQRASPDHDPNTHHCLCGADADLIMLGLATHEPNFTIIREEFKPNEPKPCEICGQMGHEMKECEGLPREKIVEMTELEKPFSVEQQFIFLRLNVLREYLERELAMPGLPFPYDFERTVDDWVFMCFFVGNDFLPHLPSLEIREGAIDRLVKLYKETVQKTGGYLTDSGVVNLGRVQLIMEELGKVEDVIFKTRKENEIAFKFRMKQKKKREKMLKEGIQKPAWMTGGQYTPSAIGSTPSPIQSPRQTAKDMRIIAEKRSQDAAAIKDKQTVATDSTSNLKRKHENDDSDSEEEPQDDVRLWEDGWKDRYYKSKFDVADNDIAFRHQVGAAYVEGLCWVLRYYYQGCASWKWFFPYHYAPFASDFINIAKLNNDFERDTEPFKPLEQLMGVFPAASGGHVPQTWRLLMVDADSSIIDFYPENFQIDLNGKKYAWQGVALLPFVDEKRLLRALEYVYPDLTAEERRRNTRGFDRLFVSKHHKVHSFLEGLYEGGELTEPVSLNPKLTDGVSGTAWLDEYAIMTGETMESPIPELTSLINNQTMSIQFRDPQYPETFLFPAKRLKGAKDPERVLKPQDWNNDRPFQPTIGFTRNRSYANLDTSGHRMLSHHLPDNDRRSGYNNEDFDRSRRNRNRDHQQESSYSQGRNSSSHSGASSLLGWPSHLAQQSCPSSLISQHSGYGSNQRGGYSGNQRNSNSSQNYNASQSGFGRNQGNGYNRGQGNFFRSNQEDNYGSGRGNYNNYNRNQNNQQSSSQSNQGANERRTYPPPPGRNYYRF